MWPPNPREGMRGGEQSIGRAGSSRQRSPAMDYRLIVLSSSGKPASVENWTCASDLEAIDRASHYVSSFGRELWQGERHVSTFAGPLSIPSAEAAELSR